MLRATCRIHASRRPGADERILSVRSPSAGPGPHGHDLDQRTQTSVPVGPSRRRSDPMASWSRGSVTATHTIDQLIDRGQLLIGILPEDVRSDVGEVPLEEFLGMGMVTFDRLWPVDQVDGVR